VFSFFTVDFELSRFGVIFFSAVLSSMYDSIDASIDASIDEESVGVKMDELVDASIFLLLLSAFVIFASTPGHELFECLVGLLDLTPNSRGFAGFCSTDVLIFCTLSI
jgi:hypothetical protein